MAAPRSHQVTILDGRRLEPIHRFASRGELIGAAQFTPDGRHALFASREGWITKFDLRSLRFAAEVRAGLETSAIALSADGQFVAVANREPHTLVVLDAGLQPLKVLDARDLAKQRSAAVSSVVDLAPRRSFAAALGDLKELWEVSYDPGAAEIADGLVHDYKLREGAFAPGFLNPRRTPLEDRIDDLLALPDGSRLIGTARDGGPSQVIHLDVRRRIATLDLPGRPNAAAAIHWQRDGRTVLGIPNLRDALVSVIDVRDWTTLGQIGTPGPVQFLRSHAGSRYAFAASLPSGEHPGTVQVIDKQRLEIVAQLRPVPGKTPAWAGFERSGRYVLISVAHAEPGLIVYDASTLKEVKRLSIGEPVGK